MVAPLFGGEGTGEAVDDDIKTKKELAVDFINAIRTMDPQALNALIVKEAGEDLAQFFLSYSANLISKDPARVLENTSSLMLMGYLIRVNEDRKGQRPSPLFSQPAAEA
jgi:hypothetical protein